MHCKDCGAENPAGNRFCGMCGAPLSLSDRNGNLQANGYFSDRHGEEPQEKADFAAPDVREVATPSVPLSTAEHERLTVEDHRNAASIPMSHTEIVQEPVIRERGSERNRVLERDDERLGESVAPSMFGLGGARPVVFSAQGDDGSYLLEEPHRTVSWRAWLLLAVIVGLGYLGWRQWYALHHPGHPDLAKVLEQDTKPSAENTAQNDSAAPAVNRPESDAAGQPATPGPAPSPNNAAPAASNASTPAAAGTSNTAAANTAGGTTGPPAAAAPGSSSGGTAPPNAAPATAAPSAAESKADTQTDEEGADTPDVPAKPSTKSNAKPSRNTNAAAATAPNFDTDPMLVRAQQYLHAHPPNCDLGVTYLQTAAESNPKARIQMAALYASGVCVRQDRAESYKWFSRAQQLDPHNSWLERNRVRLWAEMTPDERARAH